MCTTALVTRFLPALFLLSLLAAAPRAQAQDAPDDTLTTYQLDPVEVSAAPFDIAAETAPFAVSYRLRSEADLGSEPSLSLEQITRSVPGLSVNGREHYALGNRVTMRGLGWRAQFGIRGLQIVLDGIPLTTADGQAFTYIADPSFIRRAEVIRGPASVFWGNASGGVLALSTRPEGAAPHRVRARQVVGSYGLSKTDLQITPDLGRHAFSAYGSYLAQDGYRQHSDTQLGRAGFTSDVRLGDDNGLRVSGAYVNLPQADSPGSLSRDLLDADRRQARTSFVETEAGKTQEQGQLGATYYDDLGIGRLKATAYGLFRDLDNPLPFAYITFDRLAGGTRLTLENDEGPLEWGVGLEGKLQRDDRIEFSNDGGQPGDEVQTDQLETVYNQGVFARAALPLGRLNLSAGVRYDRLRFDVDDRAASDQSGQRTFRAFSPSVGLAYALPAGGRVYANFSTALEAPTTTELGNRPDGQGGFNPDIGPEHVYGLEAGARGLLAEGRLSYDVALFGLQVRDFLVPFQNDSDETFFRNAGRTRHLGAETALEWTLRPDLLLAASYTYIDAAFTEAQSSDGAALDGNRIPGVAEHLVGGRLQWRPDPLWITLAYEGRSAFFVDDANTAEADGYAVFDLRLSSPARAVGAGFSLQPFVAVNNAFDAEYIGSVVPNAFGGTYYEPSAGRHWQAGLTVQFD